MISRCRTPLHAMINEEDNDDYDLMLRDPTRPIPLFAYGAATIQDGVFIIMTMMMR